jgi:glycosyltransferase involved in cell wall biosynthesis
MRTLLFIAYYLPPMGSSGVQRPLNLLRHLPNYGWSPVVLAPETGIYHTMDHSLGEELDAMGIPIYRVKSNTPFHRGGGKAKKAPQIPEGIAKVLRWASAFRYLPDNKIGWIQPAFDLASEIINVHHPKLVFATSPPPSNLMLATKIKRHFGLPAVFDFRDDWVGNHQQIYPTPWHRGRMRQLESETIHDADALVTVNPVIRDAIIGRHPSFQGPIESVPSGYDAGRFAKPGRPTLVRDDSKITILYSGRFYGENQPDLFLKAASNIVRNNDGGKNRLRLVFQGGLDNRHKSLIQSLGLTDVVVDLGYVDHATSVANLLQSDILWLVAAHRNRGEQVSTGKVYEYMAAGKPILAIAPTGGSMHGILEDYGPYKVASPFSAGDIEVVLNELLMAHLGGTLPSVNSKHVAKYSFEAMASSMAGVFDKVMHSTSGANNNA